jgi:hypothetical protein
MKKPHRLIACLAAPDRPLTRGQLFFQNMHMDVSCRSLWQNRLYMPLMGDGDGCAIWGSLFNNQMMIELRRRWLN